MTTCNDGDAVIVHFSIGSTDVPEGETNVGCSDAFESRYFEIGSVDVAQELVIFKELAVGP